METAALTSKPDVEKKSANNNSVATNITESAENEGYVSGVPQFLQRTVSVSNSPPPPQKPAKGIGTIFQSKNAVQTKLQVGAPDDEYEKEADSVADAVTTMSLSESTNKSPMAGTGFLQAKSLSASYIQRACASCNKQSDETDSSILQRKENENSIKGGQSSLVNSTVNSPGAGNPLNHYVRSRVEPVLGSDLSSVRVHNDKNAQEASSNLNAKAFTNQNNIFLGEGQSPHDLQLMAHEATHVVQQMPNSTNFLQRENEDDEELPTAEFFNLADVREVRARMNIRFHRTANYSSGGLRAADTAKRKLTRIAGNYERAWSRYSGVIGEARAEARNQEQWANICVGIGAGVLIGLGAAFVFPTAAAGAFAIAAGEVVGVVGSAAGQAIAGAVIVESLGDSIRPSGTELEPEGMSPAVLRMEIWQNLAQMYRSALLLTETGRNLHMLTNASEYLIGEIRVHVAGGEVDMSEDETLDLMVDLVIADQRLATFDEILEEKLQALAGLESAANSLDPNDYSSPDMERDIWILWMGQLSDPSVLDLDEIEDYLHGRINILGEGSVLGVDFGGWTSSDDEQAAQSAAESHASEIRERFSQFQGDIE